MADIMSHFSVIVVGPDIEAQLQPYHEFECTGTNDQYVVDVDLTEELRKDYETGTRSMFNMPDGCRVGWGDDRLYRDPNPEETAKIGPLAGSGCGNGLSWSSQDWGDGQGYRTKIHDPEAFGAVAIELPYREAMTFKAFVDYERGDQAVVKPGEAPDIDGQAKYGYVRVDADGEVVAVIDRTNPNSHWDYWRVGGRWRGFLPVKPGAGTLAAESWEWRFDREQGHEVKPPTGVDQCTVGDLDIDRARREASAEASALFDKWERLVAEHGRARSWTEVREAEGDIDKARVLYRAQPLVDAAEREEPDGLGFRFGCWVEDLGYDRTAYIRRCENKALVPYAVVKDGKWHAKGTMLMFGCSVDEGDNSAWGEQFHRMLADLPSDTLLTVVDCHI